MAETSIINILTYKLPFELANQIYKEYQNRLKEIDYFVYELDHYSGLAEDIKTVHLMLALSIFQKRVISNLDAATKFYGNVTSLSEAETIQIGGYKLTGDERNKLLNVVLSFRKLMGKFSTPEYVFDYLETKDFLRNLMKLKKDLEDADTSKDETQGSNKDSTREEDLPF